MPRFHLTAREGDLPGADGRCHRGLAGKKRGNRLVGARARGGREAWLGALPLRHAGSGVCESAVPGHRSAEDSGHGSSSISSGSTRSSTSIRCRRSRRCRPASSGRCSSDGSESSSEGLTLGDISSSIYCSSFGGYLATPRGGAAFDLLRKDGGHRPCGRGRAARTGDVVHDTGRASPGRRAGLESSLSRFRGNARVPDLGLGEGS